MPEILQSNIPYDTRGGPGLPGVAPLRMADWLHVDDAFAQQMAERERLVTEHAEDVISVTPQGRNAAAELLEFVLNWLREFGQGYQFLPERVVRPDGKHVGIDDENPLATLAMLVQEDFCILQKCNMEHELTAAILCFPASWHLSEKIGHPLIGIHEPVAEYDARLAQRVQRLFDGVQIDRPMWRFNLLRYQSADLHQPRRAHAPREMESDVPYPYTRSERQSILRLPKSGAVVFSIHTYVVKRGNEYKSG